MKLKVERVAEVDITDFSPARTHAFAKVVSAFTSS